MYIDTISWCTLSQWYRYAREFVSVQGNKDEIQKESTRVLKKNRRQHSTRKRNGAEVKKRTSYCLRLNPAAKRKGGKAGGWKRRKAVLVLLQLHARNNTLQQSADNEQRATDNAWQTADNEQHNTIANTSGARKKLTMNNVFRTALNKCLTLNLTLRTTLDKNLTMNNTIQSSPENNGKAHFFDAYRISNRTMIYGQNSVYTTHCCT